MGRVVGQRPGGRKAGAGVARMDSNNGTEKWKREPTPTFAVDHIRPPCNSTRLLR